MRAAAMLLAAATVAQSAAAHSHSHSPPAWLKPGSVTPTDLLTCSKCSARPFRPSAKALAPKAFEMLPLGAIAPQGWMTEQLLIQANGLAGYLDTSSFPGADKVSNSAWFGGNASKFGGTIQWLPYWSNGQVPLAGLLDAAGEATKQRVETGLFDRMDRLVSYVLAHRNTTNGWIGPFDNEPGDGNGHGLWDPLNMLRTIINYAQAHPERQREVATATVAHLTMEAELLKTDPVIKWAQTRWPTFVEICQYVVDEYVPKFGAEAAVMPLGGAATTAMLLNASALFEAKGMDWVSYYHQNGSIKFPEGSVGSWNTNDHGVNNAEGAMRWPAVAYRMYGGQPDDRAQQAVMLGMLDKYQGQVAAMFCADEVFCGRAPHRGTETCTVVEAMASLEYAFEVFGDPALMDRVERLTFNALPASLTEDMWTHVYVQQANSVFAGKTGPLPPTPPFPKRDANPPMRHHSLHHAHSLGPKCARCGRQAASTQNQLGDKPSGEDQGANFYGVSHFPCCITNFPQGWPKFAMHIYVVSAKDNTVVVASLVPGSATLPASVGGGAKIVTAGQYPFGDDVTITVTAPKAMSTLVRIPGWASKATVDGEPAANGTMHKVACKAGTTTIQVSLHPEVRLEYGWGEPAVMAGPGVPYAVSGAAVPTGEVGDLDPEGGATLMASRDPGHQDVRSGSPNAKSSVTITPQLQGQGHDIEGIKLSFRYAAGYTPRPGTKDPPLGSTLSVVLIDAATQAELATVYTSPPLDKYSFDTFKGYSPPIDVDVSGLKIPNAKPVQVQLRFTNNGRNVQLQLPDAKLGFNVSVSWSEQRTPGPPPPPPSKIQRAPTDGVAVSRGALVFALHPEEIATVTQTYEPSRPKAVDYEISTNATWNYALDTSAPPVFVASPTKGWSTNLPFSTSEAPFHIKVKARRLPAWGYVDGKITDNLPPSPVDCAGCDEEVELQLVPYGGTNIRIGVFPWFH